MFPVAAFAIITGETPAGRHRRWLQPLVVLLVVCLLAMQLPGLSWLGFVLLVGCFAVAVGAWLSRGSPWLLDGKVVFYERKIHVREVVVPVSELRQVEVHFTYARGEGVGPSGFGSESNQLLVQRQGDTEPLRLNLLIESRAQRTALDGLLQRWRAQGLAVVADVF